jgi:hypothetical protein
MGKTYYEPREAAAKLGVTADELVNLVRDGRLHVRRAGEQKVLAAEEVDALAADIRRAAGRYLSDTNVQDAIDLSQADPSVLESGGSGLLELTRDRYETSLGDVGGQAEADAPPAAGPPAETADQGRPWMTVAEAASALGLNVRAVDGLIDAGELEARRGVDGSREVRVTAGPATADFAPAKEMAEVEVRRTAFDMVSRLTERREAELRLVRIIAWVAWGVVGALVLTGSIGLWWALDQRGQLHVQRATTASLSGQLSEEKARLVEEKVRTAGLTRDLEAARGKLDSLQASKDQLQADLTSAREALVESKAAAKIAEAKLETARAEMALLRAELTRAQAATQPATQPASTPGGTSEGPNRPR